MGDVVICIPNYNGEKYLREVELYDGLDYLVMDNASTDNSVAICKERGINVIENKNNVDRISNWIRCLEWFKNSNYKWLKWLFIGDSLYEDAVEVMQYAVKSYPDASVVVFDQEVYENGAIIEEWSSLEEGKKWKREELAVELVTRGNRFGSPIGIMMSQNAVKKIKEFDFHKFTWIADVYMWYQIANTGYTIFIKKNIGRFNIDYRKHFKELKNAENSFLEEIEFMRIILNDYPQIYELYHHKINVRLLFYIRKIFCKNEKSIWLLNIYYGIFRYIFK